MLIRYLIVPLAVAVVTVHAGQAGAQGAFPAPLPGRVQANDSAFPPMNSAAPQASVGAPPSSSGFPANGAAPIQGAGFGGGGPPAMPSQRGGGDECMKQFTPLREEYAPAPGKT